MKHNLLLSISSAATSIINFVIAWQLHVIISWFIGVAAGLYALYASHTTVKLNKMKMREIEGNKFSKN